MAFPGWFFARVQTLHLELEQCCEVVTERKGFNNLPQVQASAGDSRSEAGSWTQCVLAGQGHLDPGVCLSECFRLFVCFYVSGFEKWLGLG